MSKLSDLKVEKRKALSLSIDFKIQIHIERNFHLRPHKTNCMDAVRNFTKRYERAREKNTHIKTTHRFYQ